MPESTQQNGTNPPRLLDVMREALQPAYRAAIRKYTHVLNKSGRGVSSPLDAL